MRALIFLVAIVLLLALAGWISFSSAPGRSSIHLETQKIEQDTDRALESGSTLLKKANNSIDGTTTGETVSPPTSAPAPNTQ